MLYITRVLKCVPLSLLIALVLTACSTPRVLPTVMIIPTQSSATAFQAQVTPAIAVVAQVSTSVPPSSTSTPTLTSTSVETPTVAVSATLTPTATASATQSPPTQMISAATVTRTPGPIMMATPVPDAIVAGAEGLNLRSGPGTYFEPPIALLEPNTQLKFIARSPDLLWYQVETLTGQQGWTYSKLLTIYQEPPNLPIVEVALPTQPVVIVVPSSGGVAPLPMSGGGIGPLPVLGGGSGVTDRVKEIYRQGLAIGNNPRVFIKVGDSLTDNQSFMIGYGTGEYNLGSYTALQTTVDYFSDEAYTRNSIAAQAGFNAASVLDPFRVEPEARTICLPGEKPLECEIRVMKPSVAIILYGGVDVISYDAATYTSSIQQIIDIAISHGVVPVLTTFPHASNYQPENSAAFNSALRSIAAGQQLPLIDLETPARSMPHEGVKSDGFHLTMRGDNNDDHMIMLTGEETQYSGTTRNLLTLQLLDTLRIGLGMN